MSKNNKNENSITKHFDREKFIYRLLILFGIFLLIFLGYKMVNNINDEQSFMGVSRKPYKNVSMCIILGTVQPSFNR